MMTFSGHHENGKNWLLATLNKQTLQGVLQVEAWLLVGMAERA